jgi:DNA (cytosine-5)-methyltransferase 1
MIRRVIDAFCGAGGLSLGLTQAGLDVALAFDTDNRAISTYNRNSSHKCLNLDANTISGAELLDAAGVRPGELAVLSGGPPCQGFSMQRRGDDRDSRNDLLLRFLVWVEEIRPPFFLIENVSGLRGRRGRKHLDGIIRSAEELGYHCHVRLLNAADYGVPQVRNRLFIVGELLSDRRAFFNFPSATHPEGSWATVRDAIGDLPHPPSNGTEHPDWSNHRSDRLSERNQLRISHVPQGGGRADIPEELRLRCHEVHPDKAGHRYVYGRLSWDRPAGTITARFDSLTRGRFGHPAENRTISLREGARLQGFPDSFVFLGTKVEVARQIGNAVPPPLAKAIGNALAAALELRSSNQESGVIVPSSQDHFSWTI